MALTERRTQIYLTEEQYQEATNLARKRGSSLASVVREALEEFLSRATQIQMAPWSQDPASGLVGSVQLPILPSDGQSIPDLDEAIDRSVYEQS